MSAEFCLSFYDFFLIMYRKNLLVWREIDKSRQAFLLSRWQRHPIGHRNIGMLELGHLGAQISHIFDALLI